MKISWVTLLPLCIITAECATRTVVRNNDVTLTCNKVSTDGPVWWDKQSGGSSVTLSIDNTLQAGIDSGKYTVEVLGQTFALTVRNVQPTDDGTYRCYNLFGDATAETTAITVLVSPQPVNVTGADAAISEGSLIDLVCISANGKPKATLRWAKQGSESTELSGALSEETNADGTFTVTKTLSLAVGRDSAGDVYLCTATIPDIPYNETKQVPLNINLKPLAPVLTGQNETDENSFLTFTCLSAYGRPAATTVWYRGPEADPQNETLTGSTSTKINSDGTFNSSATTSFAAKYTDDQKRITCSSTNVVLESLGQNPLTAHDVITVNYRPVIETPSATPSVDEGNSIALPCNVLARPVAQIQWSHNVRIVNVSDTSFNGGTSVSPSLVIVSANASHAGVYQCKATNRLGATEGTSITLSVRHAPVITMGPGSVTGVKEGNNVILHCKVTANPPELEYIKWYKDNIEINVNANLRLSAPSIRILILIDGTVQECMKSWAMTRKPFAEIYFYLDIGGNETLTISGANRTTDAGLYKCRAKNVVGEREGSDLKLEVQYQPEGVTVSQSVVDVLEGNTPENVTCTADAIPAASYEWYRAGSGQKEVHGSVLSFAPVTGKEFGEYTCVAENTWGSANGTMLLNVSFTPYCTPGQKLKYGVKQGVPITITCNVQANPTATTFDVTLGAKQVWSGPGVAIGVNSAAVYGSFSYTPQSSADFGTFACNASNSIGVLAQQCQIQLVPAGPSEAPTNCKVSGITDTSMVVTCGAGFDGGSTQYFALQTKTSDAFTTRANQTSPAFAMSQLTKGTEYTIKVCSSNTDFSESSTCTQEMKASTTGVPDNEGGNGGSTVGHTAILLLFQAVCSLVYSNYYLV